RSPLDNFGRSEWFEVRFRELHFASVCVQSNRFLMPLSGLLLAVLMSTTEAAEREVRTNQVVNSLAPKPLAAVLPPAKWLEVERCVDRALAWLASQQAKSGTFPTRPAAEPAVESLCTMAFLSRGHQPGNGPYGEHINRAIDFVLSCQMTNGLFSRQAFGPEHEDRRASHTAVYN